ncbi:MAG: hypothetical protein AAB074_16715 [Planctomycetota bacterium]
MNAHFKVLLDRTIQLAQGFVGDVVEGALEKAKATLMKNAVSVLVGAAGLVLALVFGAIGFNRWLETIVDANYRWAPPVIVAIVSGVVGYAVTLSSRGRRGS